MSVATIPIFCMIGTWMLKRIMPALPGWALPICSIAIAIGARVGGFDAGLSIDELSDAMAQGLVGVGMWELGGKRSERMLTDAIAKRTNRSRGRRRK